MTLGRGHRTDTQLKDFSISRVHCEIRVIDDRLTIVDIEGSSGTYLNGCKISKQILNSGDMIRIGGTDIHVHLTGMADAERSSSAQEVCASPQVAAIELTGQFISHYEVGAILARGKTGTVYKARDIRDDRSVALKIFHHDFVDDVDGVQRFIRAMHTAVELKHTNLVSIFNAGKLGGLCWIAMEFVEGESLAAFVTRNGVAGMIDWTYALHVAIQMARALEVAHEHHVVHRNISPSNILVTKSSPPVAKLGDLMLAKALQGVKARTITRPGELVGDIIYMSPERTREDGQDDTRSDIYALGATLYLLLTGRPPFKADSLSATMTKIQQEDPMPPKKYQLSIPDAFQGLVLWMMAKRRESRPQTPTEVVREIERIARFSGVTI